MWTSSTILQVILIWHQQICAVFSIFYLVVLCLVVLYFLVTYKVLFTVDFHTVISMFRFLCYWPHSKAIDVYQTIQLCFYQKSIIAQLVKRTSVEDEYALSNIIHLYFETVAFFLWVLLERGCSWNLDKLIRRFLWCRYANWGYANLPEICSSASIFWDFCSDL